MGNFTHSAIAVVVLITSFCSAQTIRPIAYSGQAAPGVEAGARFAGFGIVSLADSGMLAFTARLDSTSNINGVWTYQDGVLQKVAREGEPVPADGISEPDPRWSRFDYTAINDAGQVAILGAYQSPSVLHSHAGIWLGAPGALSPLALTPSPAPGIPGATLGAIAARPFMLDNQGRVAFYGSLAGPINTALWLGKPGSVELVARQGDPAPGAEPGVVFGPVQPVYTGTGYLPALLANGTVAFYGSMVGANIGSRDIAIWSGTPGSLSMVVRNGDIGPAGLFTLPRGNPGLDLNNAGEVAFMARASTGSGLWLRDRDGFVNIAHEGQRLGGDLFNFLYPPRINASGDVVFHSSLATVASSIWTWSGGQLQKIEEKPGLGVLRYSLGGADHDQFDINDSGQIAFISLLQRSNQPDFLSLWGYDPGSGLHLLAENGQSIEVAPGDVRTIRSIFYPYFTALGDSRGIALNNSGEVAFTLTFTDGSTGIFLATIPEPATLATLPFALLLLSRRRSRTN